MKRTSEISYGIIPLRNKEGEWEVLLIQHHAGHWAFPKGKPEGKAKPMDTALRELQEETGLRVEKMLSDQPFSETYSFVRNNVHVDKKVEYFPALVTGEVHIQASEIADHAWVPVTQAWKKATFPEAQRLCKAVDKWLTDEAD